MAVDFDTPLSRSRILSMRLKAAGTEIRIAVELLCEDGSVIETSEHIPPSEMPSTAKAWFEAYLKPIIAARYTT